MNHELVNGFGGSQQPMGRVSISDFADDVVGVMDYAGVGTASILGFSMGGLVALEVYRFHPWRVDSLILADTSPRLAVDVEAIRRTFSSPETAYQSLASLTYRPESRSSLKLLAEALARNDPDYIALVAEALRGVDYWSLLPEIRIPVLIVVGENDTLVPPVVARRMAEEIPNAILEIISNAGHLSKFDNPTAFNNAVARFLGKVYNGKGHGGKSKNTPR